MRVGGQRFSTNELVEQETCDSALRPLARINAWIYGRSDAYRACICPYCAKWVEKLQDHYNN